MTDAEWFYLMSSAHSFRSGEGAPGKAPSTEFKKHTPTAFSPSSALPIPVQVQCLELQVKTSDISSGDMAIIDGGTPGDDFDLRNLCSLSKRCGFISNEIMLVV
ncbi:hypothetical protein NL676_010934 [Syzygium grande]|nr:hypothetical protein NL676_010934 [Syzygium grande]